ncbi:hypothetical protein [Janthinobacterium sp. RB2R34]|uniref:hypothetical protein n=1 Tax=Janthinobacterium sp. RB2R34 TaxID=3424193 RepID=UPI003F29C73C
MASLSSINSLQAGLATAQRRVEQGQNQVQRDSEQLASSQRQLVKEKEQLSDTQRSTQQAQANSQAPVKVPQLDQAIKVAVPSQLGLNQPVQPQLNSFGQSIGRLINTTA